MDKKQANYKYLLRVNCANDVSILRVCCENHASIVRESCVNLCETEAVERWKSMDCARWGKLGKLVEIVGVLTILSGEAVEGCGRVWLKMLVMPQIRGKLFCRFLCRILSRVQCLSRACPILVLSGMHEGCIGKRLVVKTNRGHYQKVK